MRSPTGAVRGRRQARDAGGSEHRLQHSRTDDLGRWHVDRFVREAAATIPAGARVLDAGAGESVYRPLFAHCDYRSADLAVGNRSWDYGGLDVVAALDRLPIADGAFDAILCTQVLEHLVLPAESLAEMCRVLRPGGTLYLTAPMAQAEHQVPHDFFRYTSFGLRALCARAGFSDVRVTPFGGQWTRWAYELPGSLSAIPVSGLRSGHPRPLGMALAPVRLAAKAVVRTLQHLCLRLDRLDTRRDFPFGWSCVATR